MTIKTNFVSKILLGVSIYILAHALYLTCLFETRLYYLRIYDIIKYTPEGLINIKITALEC